MHNLKQRALRGVFWASAENWSRQLISLVVFMVLVRILTPSEIGLYAIVTVVIALMQIFLDNGIGEAIVQRHDLEPDHLDAGFWTNTILSVILCGAAMLLAGPLAGLFGDPALADLIPLASLIIVIGSLSSIQQALLRRSLDFRSLAMRTVASILVSGAVGVGMALAGYGVWALAGQQITEKTVGAAVLWSRSTWRPRWRLSGTHVLQLLPYSASMIGSQALVFVQHQFDRFMIGLMLGPVALGIYSLSVKILDSFAGMLFYGTASASFSTFTKLQDQPAKLREALFLMSRFSSMLGFPFFVGLAVTAPDLIRLVFGEKWDGSGDILQVLALTGIPWLFATSAGTVTRAAGKADWYLALTALSVGLKVALLLIFAGKGLYVLTVAFTVGDFVMIPLFILVTRAIVPMSPWAYLRCYADAVAGSAVMAIAVLTIQFRLPGSMEVWQKFAVSVSAGVVVYAMLIAVIAWPTVKRMIALISVRGVPGTS